MAIAFIQQNSGLQGSSTTTISLSYSSNNVAGNLLVLVTKGEAGISVSTVTDTQGNIWHPAVADGSSIPSAIWYSEGCKAGPNTVTVTYNAAGFPRLIIAEYSGVVISGSLDKTSSSFNNGGTDTAYNSGNTAVISQANELLIGSGGNNSGAGQTVTPSSGWTQRAILSPSPARFDINLTDQIVSVAAAYANSGTYTASSNWTAVIATFKGAGVSVYSVPDCRAVTATTPNSSRTVNATLIYDVPKADSRAQGAPVDSRAQGAPVASDASYPQNSRTPGTIGPGE